MISPVIFYNLILSVVGLFQYFLVPLVLNQGTGAPGGASMFYNLYLYKTFFVYQNMSYGSTLAWVLFIVILIVTVLLFSTARYWVYYASDKGIKRCNHECCSPITQIQFQEERELHVRHRLYGGHPGALPDALPVHDLHLA